MSEVMQVNTIVRTKSELRVLNTKFKATPYPDFFNISVEELYDCCKQEAIKRLSARHGNDEEDDMAKLRRFSGESAAIARLHDEGQASLAPRQLDDFELERAMVRTMADSAACVHVPGLARLGSLPGLGRSLGRAVNPGEMFSCTSLRSTKSAGMT